MQNKTKLMILIAMLSAISLAAVTFGRIPLVLFLKYEPKDIIIVLGGFIWGPMVAFMVALISSFLEMITISADGVIGFLMNVLASIAFACTASIIYKIKRNMAGAIIGLISGSLCMVAVMLLWNYIMTPIFMGIPRADVVPLLIPAILPFNFIKASLNSAFTLLLYRPIVNALRRAKLVEDSRSDKRAKFNAALIISSLIVIVSSILFALALNGKI